MRIFLVCAIFFVGGVAPVLALETDSLKVQALLAEGDVFYRRLDNRLAIASYQKAFAIDSTSFAVLTRLSRTATDLGKDLEAENKNNDAVSTYEEAIRYAELLHAKHANNAKTHYFLALTKGNLALIQGGRQKVSYSREVEDHCLKGLALDSTDADLLVAYGVFHREVASSSWMERTLAKTLFGDIPVGTKEESVRLLTQAVQIAPQMHIAHFELAVALIAIGESDKAISHLEKARTLPAQTTQDNRNRELAELMLKRMAQ